MGLVTGGPIAACCVAAERVGPCTCETIEASVAGDGLGSVFRSHTPARSQERNTPEWSSPTHATTCPPNRSILVGTTSPTQHTPLAARTVPANPIRRQGCGTRGGGGEEAVVTARTVKPTEQLPLPPRLSKSLGDSPRLRAAFRCPPEATVRQLSSTRWLRGLSPQSRSDAEDTVHRAVERKIGRVAVVTVGTVEQITQTPLPPRLSKSLGDSHLWRSAFRCPPATTSSPTRRLPLAAGTVPAKPV